MMTFDHDALVAARQNDLLAQAERDRLAALVPAQPGGLRRVLAVVCLRLATWLDTPAGYVQIPEAGPEDWVTPWASV
jgi:hypothetical protein